VTDLESSALTGSRLLLDGHDLQNLILQDFVCQEEVDDLKLLNGTEHTRDYILLRTLVGNMNMQRLVDIEQ